MEEKKHQWWFWGRQNFVCSGHDCCLLVMDPTLKIMIVTKENVAAHAFAKHFLRLGSPDSINTLIGRLVGCWIAERPGKQKRTLMSLRHFGTRSKKVLIGCGGGFHQECSQPYSPVAKWIEDAVVALNDSLFRLLWIFQLIDSIFRLLFLPSTGSRWMCCNLSLLNSEVSTIFSKGAQIADAHDAFCVENGWSWRRLAIKMSTY